MRRFSPLLLLACLACVEHVPAMHGPRLLPALPIEPPLGPRCASDSAHALPAHEETTTVPAPNALPDAATAVQPGDSAVVPGSPASDEDDAAPDGDDAPYENGGIDDGEPEAPRADVPDPTAPAPTDPRLSFSDEELRRRVKAEPATLGSLSLGTPAAGSLFNAVAMPSSQHWDVVDGAANWGTEETVSFLTSAMTKVYEKYPTAPRLQVGHLSARRGGPLSPHRSHQSGRDVDLGYFYKGDHGVWYRRANAENLDTARSWELVRALITETDVEYVFVNLSVQKLLKEHALSVGEDPAWLDGLFQFGTHNPNAIVRHVHGHDTHLHVRFFNPIAEELGRRALPYLPDRRLVERREEEGLVPYRIHKGETLAVLAKKFNTTVAAIQKANRLRSLKVVAGRTYLVPQKTMVQRSRPMRASPRVAVPPRRRPPAHPRG